MGMFLVLLVSFLAVTTAFATRSFHAYQRTL